MIVCGVSNSFCLIFTEYWALVKQFLLNRSIWEYFIDSGVIILFWTKTMLLLIPKMQLYKDQLRCNRALISCIKTWKLMVFFKINITTRIKKSNIWLKKFSAFFVIFYDLWITLLILAKKALRKIEINQFFRVMPLFRIRSYAEIDWRYFHEVLYKGKRQSSKLRFFSLIFRILGILRHCFEFTGITIFAYYGLLISSESVQIAPNITMGQ
jgi:hypothetical protein